MYAYVSHNLPTNRREDPDAMITQYGRVLRKYSLDELPQLFNVIIGNMSLVGPRPLIPEEQDMHVARLKNGVYLVRPGITGLAQIKGRDMIESQEKAYWDTQYVQNISFTQDLKIILQSIPRVFQAEGVDDKKKHQLSS